MTTWILSARFGRVYCTLGVAVLTSSVVAGCGEKPSTPTILQARAQPYVVDVPVPDDFDLERHKSTHNFSSGHRTIKHFYIGRDTPLAVGNFYRSAMPDFQWELIDKRLQNGVDFLNYRKGEERCEIRIETLPGGLFGSKTQVSVNIQPNP